MAALRTLILLPAFAALLWGGGAAAATELRVTVRGVQTDQGDIKVGLYATPEAFDKRKRTYGMAAPAHKGEVTVVFPDIPPGRYGIAAIHDIDGDGELNQNMLGVPTEPYGFGNDAKVNLAPPAFDDMAVTIGTAPVATTLTLR